MAGFWFLPPHFERSRGKGRNQSENESNALKKGHKNPALAKPPQRPLRLDTYWDGRAAALQNTPRLTLEPLPPPGNKVAINHLCTGDLNHGSEPHNPCTEINLWRHPHREPSPHSELKRFPSSAELLLKSFMHEPFSWCFNHRLHLSRTNAERQKCKSTSLGTT